VTQKYYPLWYTFNGHLQTLKLAKMNESAHPKIPYERELVTLPDGGIVSLDWALTSSSIVASSSFSPQRNKSRRSLAKRIDPTCPTMLILPGLTGGSQEHYIRTLVERMLFKDEWQIVVFNARGCASTPLKTAQLFSSAYTEDLRWIVKYLFDTYKLMQVVGVGFSMGSNVLVKYLGEEQNAIQLCGAISIGNPFDLLKCSEHLTHSFFHRNVYDRVLVKNLKQLFFEKSNAAMVDFKKLKKAKTVLEFDDLLTKFCFGYETVDHYYVDASSSSRLEHVRIPLLCLNAKDDPICTQKAIPYHMVHKNPNIILCVTEKGGHLGFFENNVQLHTNQQQHENDNDDQHQHERVNVWSVRVIAEFAESIIEMLEENEDK
jgi:predicted alpha/beta-fold hydrolase